MSVDWGLEYLKGNIPGSRQESLAQTPPEKLAVPATTRQEINRPEAQKTEIENRAEPPGSPTHADGRSGGVEVPVNQQKIIDSIVAFLRKYLACDDHQLTILALWVIHTWCYDLFSSTAYLDVRSPQPECGKTRCLELLDVISRSSCLASGPRSTTIIDLLLQGRSLDEFKERKAEKFLTVLLDDCHHTFGPSERQQLLAMLNSGTRRMSWYLLGSTYYSIFCPKAFAGNSPLPPSLAARCIPIMLKRKKPSEVIARLDVADALDETAAIVEALKSMDKDRAWLQSKIDQGPPKLAARVLTAHEQDCAEPLLYIADAIGGPWPQKARDAIVICSKRVEENPSVQVLADIRTWLFLKKDPEYVASRDLLRFLGSMDYRPWAGWNHLSGKCLGKLLKPFGIISRRFTAGTEKFQGYVVKEFHDAWDRYLQPFPTKQDLADRERILVEGGAPE